MTLKILTRVECQNENRTQLQSDYYNKKQGNLKTRKHEVLRCTSSWNPSNSLKHQVSEACLLGPRTTVQPAENSNKTEGERREEGSHVS